MIKNKKQLIRILKKVAMNSKNMENRIFATALLYLVKETIQKDRTTEAIK